MEKKTWILYIITLILTFPVILAQSPDFYVRENVAYDLKFSCSLEGNFCNSGVNCNLTINYPNSSILINKSSATNLMNGYFKYSLTSAQTTPQGVYTAIAMCSNGSLSSSTPFTYEVTGIGQELDQPKSIVYVALLFLIVFLFLLTIFGISKLPASNETTDEGMLLSISKLKYLRPVLFVIAWLLLIAICFTGSNISYAYLGTKLFSDLLFNIYRIMFSLTLPMILVWVGWIFVKLFQDKEFKSMMERGLPIEDRI